MGPPNHPSTRSDIYDLIAESLQVISKQTMGMQVIGKQTMGMQVIGKQVIGMQLVGK